MSQSQLTETTLSGGLTQEASEDSGECTVVSDGAGPAHDAEADVAQRPRQANVAVGGDHHRGQDDLDRARRRWNYVRIGP